MPKHNNRMRQKKQQRRKYYKSKSNANPSKSNESNNIHNKSKTSIANIVKQQLHLIINNKSQDPNEIQSKCFNLIKFKPILVKNKY